MNTIHRLLISTGLTVVSAGFLFIAVPAQGQIAERSIFPGQCGPIGDANKINGAGGAQCERLPATNAIAPTTTNGKTDRTATSPGGNTNPGTPVSGGDPGTGSGGDPGTGSGGDPGTGSGGDPGTGGGGDPGTGSGGDPGTGSGGDPGTGSGGDHGTGSGGDPGTGSTGD